MDREPLIVALGERRYRVERPWGDLAGAGKVTDVAIDGAGRIAVLCRTDPYTEHGPQPLRLLDRAGRALAAFGADVLADAHMVAADPLGRLWVVDRDAHEIVGFGADGRPFTRLGTRNGPLCPFNHPSDIAFGPGGEIVVADGYGNGRVHVFGPTLEPIAAFGDVGTAPGQFLTAHGVWVTADRRVVVADRENNRLQLFTMKGELLAIWGGFQRPSDIWGDREGRLYVTDAIPTLACLAPDGTRLGRCRPVLNGAHGLWGDDRDGTLYLAEGTPSRVTRLVPIA